MSLSLYLVVSSDSRVSRFSLLLDEAIVLPELSTEGMIVGSILLDLDSIIAEMFLALMFAIDGCGGS